MGHSDEEARHWLLLDRERQTLYVGEADEVERFLSLHAPPPPTLTPEQIEKLSETLRESLEQWRIQPVDPQAIEQAMRRETQLVQDLQDWLDTK